MNLDSNDDAARIDDHDFIVIVYGLDADDGAGLFGNLVALDALAAPVMEREFVYKRALAVAVFGGNQDRIALGSQLHGDDMVAVCKVHADDSVGSPARAADVGQLEADRLAVSGEEHGLVRIVCLLDFDQEVVVAEIYRNQAVLVDIRVFGKLGLLSNAVICSHEEVLVVPVVLHRDHRGDVLVRLQVDEVDNGRAPGGSGSLGNLIYLEFVDPALVREEEHVVVGRGLDHVDDIVVFNGLDALDALSSPALDLEVVNAHALDVAELGEGDNGFRIRNQIFVLQLFLVVADGSPPVVTVLVGNFEDFLPDDAKQEILISEDGLVFFNPLLQLGIFLFELAPLQTGQGTETHVHDGLGLLFGQAEPLHEAFLGELYRFG